jgi:hypothetical protein
MSESANPNPPLPEVDYDRHEARSGLIAAISVSIIALLLVLIGGVYYLYMVAYEAVEYRQYSGVPSRELKAIHDREEDHLHRYSYIDKEKGVIRIPIERAMELLTKEVQAGKVFYNTATYPAKEEPPGGAAGGSAPPAPAQTAANANDAAPANP